MSRKIQGKFTNGKFCLLIDPAFEIWIPPTDLKKSFQSTSVARCLVTVKSISGKSHHTAVFGNISQLGSQSEETSLVLDDILVETTHRELRWALGPV